MFDPDDVTMEDRSSEPPRRHRPHVQAHGRGRSPSRTRTYDRDAEPLALLGQFSFAPATQTTVVTTTTTTTTKFPPFLMRPPRGLRYLNLKQYPLAAVPTPANLRNIHFEIGGKETIFREAEDTTLALEQLGEEQQTLRRANGTLRVVETYKPWTKSATDELHERLGRFHGHKRPASPESITDNVDTIDAPAFSSNTIPPRRRTVERREWDVHQSVSRLQDIHRASPITPESNPKPSRGVKRRGVPDSDTPARSLTALLPSPSMDQQPVFPRPPSDTSKPDYHIPSPLGDGRACLSDSGTRRRSSSHEAPLSAHAIDEELVLSSTRPLSRRALSAVPARLNVAESPSAVDGSLPSPSLSPVTAAATLQNGDYFTDPDGCSEGVSPRDLAASISTLDNPASMSSTARATTDSDSRGHSPSFTTGVVSDIPAILEYFEAIPDELKSYVMHQLLRRCPKPTLQIVADAVNPALKCDFLTNLPPELALCVVRHLDLKSLCKAAQVSKKWRHLINSDEKTWKDLFDQDGFILPDGELQRAVAEGWGWQDPYGPASYEENLNHANPGRSESENRFTGILRRSKRKATTVLSNRAKQVKRKNSGPDESIDMGSMDWTKCTSTVEGPYKAATAAVRAIPDSTVGLPSLKGLHLYKSLYRRHYIIRKNWLLEDTKPQHIAFRAHESHVVTCLQFDTDKILTGSDDNNINVYETRTGILRAILTGHEGGVWALQYDGNTLVSGSTDRSVRVWNIQEGRETQVFRGHTSTVRCLQIVLPVQVGEMADGKPVMMPKQPLIITGSRDSTLRVWKLPRTEDPPFIQAENETDAEDCPYFVRLLTGHQHSVRALAAYADTLVSGSYDCTVRVWKISTGETIHRLQGHAQKVYSVVLDHERNRCISGSMDNMVRIWDLNTGSLRYTLEGHTSLVGLLDLKCDKLVSAAADSTLRIWDPENGQCKATLTAHTGAITCFRHDGQKVISGSDRNLKLWNIKTGECVKDLLSDLSGVWQVKFNERRCVAAVQRDGLTYIEVLDYGATRDGVPEHNLGRRILVDADGFEDTHDDGGFLDLDGSVEP